MRFLILVLALSLAYWGVILNAENNANVLEVSYKRVYDVKDCTGESVPEVKDYCIMNAALTVGDNGLCYRISDPAIASECFRGFVSCRFPYVAHYRRNTCAVGLDTIIMYVMVWTLLVSILLLVFKFRQLREWFIIALLFYIAGIGVMLTQDVLYHRIAAFVSSLGVPDISVDSEVSGKLVYLSPSGVVKVVVQFLILAVGVLVGRKIPHKQD